MSTGTRVPHAIALASAERFKQLFAGTFESWTIAGSIRRQRPMVGDCEHVVIPKIVPLTEESFFGSKTTGELNRVWETTESLLRTKYATKAEYGSTRSHRWGEKLRGLVFEGVRHEIFMADARNHGAILTIRTGPSEFSERLVTILKQGGRYRQVEGYVRLCSDGEPFMDDDSIVATPDEASFFKLCNMPLIAPEKRDAWAAAATGVRR